jgi:hypothetical protein
MVQPSINKVMEGSERENVQIDKCVVDQCVVLFLIEVGDVASFTDIKPSNDNAYNCNIDKCDQEAKNLVSYKATRLDNLGYV